MRADARRYWEHVMKPKKEEEEMMEKWKDDSRRTHLVRFDNEERW